MSGQRLDLISTAATLDLVNADGADDDGYWFEVNALAGFSWGSPEAVRVIVESLMRDGDDSRISRYGNRTVSFVVKALGTDLVALGLAERALALACKGRSELSFTPPDDGASPTVFDVMTATFDPIFDDVALVRDGVKEQRYTVTLECLPFSRAADWVVQTLEPVSTPTVHTLDDCSSAAAWSSGGGMYPPTITQQTYLGESVIRATHTFVGFNQIHSTNVKWTGSDNTDPYVYIDICWDGDGAPFYRNVTLLGQRPFTTGIVIHGTGVYTRYWFNNPASATSLNFTITRSWPNDSLPTVPVPLRIAELKTADAVGGGGIQTVDTISSVRSPGSVLVTRDTAMDYLFIYADPSLQDDGWSPQVKESWASAPAGTYKIYVSGLGSIGDLVEVTVTDTSGHAAVASTRLKTAPTFRPIGEVRLGGSRSGRLGALTFSAKVNGSTTALTMANVRLFRDHDDASLTYIDESASTVELTTPSIVLERGGLWVDDWTAFDTAITWDFIDIVTPSTSIYLESNGSEPPVSQVSYQPHSHTFNTYSDPDS